MALKNRNMSSSLCMTQGVATKEAGTGVARLNACRYVQNHNCRSKSGSKIFVRIHERFLRRTVMVNRLANLLKIR